MRVIDAVWEQRNLGVDCAEVILDQGDDVEQLLTNLVDIETEYTVIKVPVARPDLLMALPKAGYFFIEAITACHHLGVLPPLSPIQNRLMGQLQYAPMVDADVFELYKEIRGGMLKEDRISLDPYFTQDLANNRYIGWINDEIERGSILYKLVFRDQNVGFFNMRNTGNNICNATIGGIYPNFQKIGLGVGLNYFEIFEGIRQGARKICTSFSTNNRGAYAIHLSLGYILDTQYYVFIKHQ